MLYSIFGYTIMGFQDNIEESNITIGEIIWYLKGIASIMCIFAFLVCVIKMITGDEHDFAIYKKRAIYCVIALIIILLISNIHNSLAYFKKVDQSIGTSPKKQSQPIFSVQSNGGGVFGGN